MPHFVVTPKLNVVPKPTKGTKAPRIETVLEELFVLLEDYAPVWYTKKHHDRAIQALRAGGRDRRIASRSQRDAESKDTVRKCG